MSNNNKLSDLRIYLVLMIPDNKQGKGTLGSSNMYEEKIPLERIDRDV